jgi:hypothetical protein
VLKKKENGKKAARQNSNGLDFSAVMKESNRPIRDIADFLL